MTGLNVLVFMAAMLDFVVAVDCYLASQVMLAALFAVAGILMLYVAITTLKGY